MNHAPGGKSLLLEIGQNTAIESLGFSEIGVSQCGRLIRVALADVLQRAGSRSMLPSLWKPSRLVHHLVHVQRVVLDVGGDTPHASVRDQRAMDVRRPWLGLHDAALVVASSWATGRGRRSILRRSMPSDGRLEQLWRVDLGDRAGWSGPACRRAAACAPRPGHRPLAQGSSYSGRAAAAAATTFSPCPVPISTISGLIVAPCGLRDTRWSSATPSRTSSGAFAGR